MFTNGLVFPALDHRSWIWITEKPAFLSTNDLVLRHGCVDADLGGLGPELQQEAETVTQVSEGGAGEGWTFINTHTHTPDCPCLHPAVGFLLRVHISLLLVVIREPLSLGYFLGSGATLSRSDSFKEHRVTSDSHVQLQLLPGQVWPRGKGASAQIQREELRLLHEDHLLILLSDPVPHHRQSGALPHLRTAGTICGGEESQGQCEGWKQKKKQTNKQTKLSCESKCQCDVVLQELEVGFNKLSENNIQLRKEKSELAAQLGARTAEKAAVEKELEKAKADSNATEYGLKQKYVSAPTFQPRGLTTRVVAAREITHLCIYRMPARKRRASCRCGAAAPR